MQNMMKVIKNRRKVVVEKVRKTQRRNPKTRLRRGI